MSGEGDCERSDADVDRVESGAKSVGASTDFAASSFEFDDVALILIACVGIGVGV